MFFLFNMMIGLSFLLFDIAVLLTTGDRVFYIGIFLYFLYTLAVLIPSLAVTVRRLHDTGRSGWFFFIALVPLVGGFIFLYFLLEEGNKEVNKFGPQPNLEIV